MLNEELHIFRVSYAAKYMDMSAGDSVDGPRWTGEYVTGDKTTALVVAATEDFARAFVVSIMGEEDGGTTILDTEDLGECAGIVEIQGPNGKRCSIIRPFSVEAKAQDIEEGSREP